MILLFFTFCSSTDIHYFSFNDSKTFLQHNVEHDITKLGKNLKLGNKIIFIDSQISKKNAIKFFHFVEKYSGLSLIISGLQTKIIFNSNYELNLKNANLTFRNITFTNCDSSYFNIIDSSFNLENINFFGKSGFSNKTLLNLINCTSEMDQVYFRNHNRSLILSNSSILFTQYLYFDNITIKSSEYSAIHLITTSFESSYIKLRRSNISHLLYIDNSNIFISNLNAAKSTFSSILIHSIFSNILVRYVKFNKCQGPILSSINDSTFQVSNIQVTDHLSEYPLLYVSDASLSVLDSQFQDSQIDSIATLNKCSSFFFTNSSISYLMAAKTLFEIQKTTSAEFSQLIIYRLVSQADIGIMHADNCDYTKISQTLIEGFVSQSQRSSALAFSDVSSIYVDDFNYTQNGVPLMVASQSNVVFANSYLYKNDCIEYVKSSIPSSFMTLLAESSLHFINTQIIGNKVPGGFSLLSVNSLVFFMKITFSKNNAPLQFIQSDVKLSKSVFKNNLKRVIESHFSNINIHKCLFSSDKKVSQIFAGNESKTIVNTIIVNSTYFIEADPSATSVTIGTGRFLYSFKRAISIDTKRTRLFLLDTKFNCSVECEKTDIKSEPNIFGTKKNELPFPQSTQFLIKDVKEDKIEIDHTQQPLTLSTTPFINNLNRNNFDLDRKMNNDSIQITSDMNKIDVKQDNNSVINLPNTQLSVGYQVWIVLIPIFFLCAIFIYRFKSPKFRRMTKKSFSQKGRYQL